MNTKRPNRLPRREALKLSGATIAGAAFTSAWLGSGGLHTLAQDQATPDAESPQVIVDDVVDYQLDSEGDWEGHFGSVTLTMHAGFFDGDDAWFIRTDASDQEFAEANGLVYVPLLANALDAEGSFATIYLFDGGVDEQRSVLSTVPTNDDFTPAFRVNNVSFAGEATLLSSVEDITAAAEDGMATIEETEIVVNYPLVLWPGGGLPVDPDLTNPLGPGNLIADPDTEAGTVTFKLHQCYPGSRYIATDTSAVPMAGMMGVVASAPTQKLIEANATAPIYVFGNGIAGPAAMGFQPSIFNSKAGDVIWSPFWEHFTVVWNEGFEPALLTSEAEVMEREAAGEITIHPGTPDTEGQSFVVNCPAPVLAHNDFDPATFIAG
ncbi:hypothetical protein BH23CHL4_BH23CHL4_01910 [soil metagenome]